MTNKHTGEEVKGAGFGAVTHMELRQGKIENYLVGMIGPVAEVLNTIFVILCCVSRVLVVHK